MADDVPLVEDSHMLVTNIGVGPGFYLLSKVVGGGEDKPFLCRGSR